MRPRTLKSATFFLALGITGCGGGASAPAPATNTAKPAAPAPATPTPAATSAETPVENADAGYRYVVPTGWKSERGEGYALLVSPDSSVRIAVLTADAGLDKDLGKAIEAEVQHVVKDLKRDGAVEHRDVNGIATDTAKGTGTYEGHEIRWSANRLEMKKPVFVVGFASSKDYDANKPAVDRFVASFKKI